MDDAGLKLIRNSSEGSLMAKFGQLLVSALPLIIKGLAVVGTAALILVSGGIFVHNIDYLHHLWPGIPTIVKEFIIGFVAGLIIVGIVNVLKELIGSFKKNNNAKS